MLACAFVPLVACVLVSVQCVCVCGRLYVCTCVCERESVFVCVCACFTHFVSIERDLLYISLLAIRRSP